MVKKIIIINTVVLMVLQGRWRARRAETRYFHLTCD